MPDSIPFSLNDRLAAWLAAGGRLIGELAVLPREAGWEIRHHADADVPEDGLAWHATPEAARELAKNDAQGRFRPLKAAPTLPRGWRLRLADLTALRQALDFFYPAAIGNWAAFCQGRATPVPASETFARQTGMYQTTRGMTPDDTLALAREFCEYATRCRRRIAWPLAAGQPAIGLLPAEKTDLAPGAHEWPILCLEPCNLFVAAARGYLKKKRGGPATKDGP